VSKAASKTAHLDHEDFQMGPSKPGKEPTSHAHVPVSDEDREFYRQLVEQREHDSELSEQAEKRVVNTKDHIDLMQHMIEAHDRYPEDHDFARKNPINTDTLGESDEDMDRDLTHAEMQKVHDHEHGEYPDDFPTATTLDGSHFHTASKTAADNPVFLAPDSPTPDDNQDLSDEEWKQQNSNQWGPNIAGRVRSEWRKRIKSALNQHGVPYERFFKKTKDIHGWGSELRILHHYGKMLQEDPYLFHDVAKSIANLSNNKSTSSQNPRTLPFIEKFQSLQKTE
jgi:DNA primase